MTSNPAPSADPPLVAIGLPTFNGARYIRDALGSLLAQDHPEIEILVSDNASTDETATIVAEFAAGESRLRLIRQPVNIGAAANFNHVFRETTGRYFMWASDDDCWEPTYVSKCVAALERAPEAVLACTRLAFMDEAGRPVNLDPALYDNPDLATRSLGERVGRLMRRGGWYQIYGLTRRDALARTRLFTNTYGPDVVLLMELALQGPFALVPESLFRYRHFEVRTEIDRGARSDSIGSRVLTAPYTSLQEALSKAISTSNLALQDRLRAHLALYSAAYFSPTPLRARIVPEIRPRLRRGVRERRIRDVAKYGAIAAAIQVRRFVGRSRSA